MLEQIAEHLKGLGPQGDCLPGPGQRIELGIEETIGEDIAHRAILRAAPVLLAAPYAGSGGVGCTDVPVYQKRRAGYIAGKCQLPAGQRSGRSCPGLLCLGTFAERGATLAGAGPASQDGGGAHRRGPWGDGFEQGDLGRLKGSAVQKDSPNA
jgi:hypothetical protein